jgi:hypothetical protein
VTCFRTAVSMTAEGPRKGEPSTKTMRYGLRIQSVPLVRGSSRRIMSLRFRPAHISVITRRDCYSVVIGTPLRKFFLSLWRPSIRGERSLSRIHVVALRASLTDSILHQNCSAHESEGKNILVPPAISGGLTQSLHISLSGHVNLSSYDRKEMIAGSGDLPHPAPARCRVDPSALTCRPVTS